MCPGRADGYAASGRSARRLPVVAIDGPAGSGKSTVARRVAAVLGFVYLDTGAMYRAVTWAACQAGLFRADGRPDPEAVTFLAETADIAFRHEADGAQGVLLNGEEVTSEIRGPEVERLVPRVASVPGVRQAMIPRQRRLARCGGIVVDGRDIGTAVLPDADHKFFVTAAFEVRVERRHRQLTRQVPGLDPEQVAADLRARDTLDQTRSEGPLRCADDAVVLDTTALTIEEVVGRIVEACGGGQGDAALAVGLLGGRGHSAADSEAGGP